MKNLLILLLVLTTGCQASLTNAEANLTEAKVNLTEAEANLTEVQSDAETIAALVAELRERDDLDQAVIDALLAELEAGRASRHQTESALLELVKEAQRSRAPWWSAPALALFAGVCFFLLWREQQRSKERQANIDAELAYYRLQAVNSGGLFIPEKYSMLVAPQIEVVDVEVAR